MIDKVKQHAACLKYPKNACLGLAFKASIDDFREPAVKIVSRLANEDVGEIFVVEPHSTSLPNALEEAGIQLLDTSEALQRPDIVPAVVDHERCNELYLVWL